MRSGRRGGSLVAIALLALASAVAGGLAAPGRAALGIACPDPTTKAFSRWGDTASYSFVPNGGFESAASGWTVTGSAAVVSGNERFYLHGLFDDSALRLPAGSSATSPQMCIGLLSSKMRFVVGGAAGGTLRVEVLYRGIVSNLLGARDGGTVSTDGTWQPSPGIAMAGGLVPVGTTSVQFRFVSTSGAPLLDDVYLDPYKVT